MRPAVLAPNRQALTRCFAAASHRSVCLCQYAISLKSTEHQTYDHIKLCSYRSYWQVVTADNRKYNKNKMTKRAVYTEEQAEHSFDSISGGLSGDRGHVPVQCQIARISRIFLEFLMSRATDVVGGVLSGVPGGDPCHVLNSTKTPIWHLVQTSFCRFLEILCFSSRFPVCFNVS